MLLESKIDMRRLFPRYIKREVKIKSRGKTREVKSSAVHALNALGRNEEREKKKRNRRGENREPFFLPCSPRH